MLPYGMVRYHNAPADLRDIPLGTVLHVRAFLEHVQENASDGFSRFAVTRFWR